MIWRLLSATAVFAIIYVGWLVFGYTGNAVNNQILSNPIIGGATSPAGLTIGTIMTQTTGLFMAGIVATVFFLATYLIAGAHAEENDSGIVD